MNLSSDPTNSVAITKPVNYDSINYELLKRAFIKELPPSPKK